MRIVLTEAANGLEVRLDGEAVMFVRAGGVPVPSLIQGAPPKVVKGTQVVMNGLNVMVREAPEELAARLQLRRVTHAENGQSFYVAPWKIGFAMRMPSGQAGVEWTALFFPSVQGPLVVLERLEAVCAGEGKLNGVLA